jgi:hypothetical protein
MTLAMREKFLLVVLAEKGEDCGGPVGDRDVYGIRSTPPDI